MPSTNSQTNIMDAVGADRLEQARLDALEYHLSGGLAPYEESFSLGDVKDVRFASLSFWPSKDPDSDDIVSSIRIYLKRRPVHPEAHSVTATVFVQDDHQTHVLGVNNLCRPGTLRPCLEPVAGKIDPGDSEWATWEHECAEERGIIPGYPFKSLQFLSKGFAAEKAPSCLVSRTFVIEAALRIQDAVFDPSSMQPNKLSPTEIGVVQQTTTRVKDLEEYQMKAAGMHICPSSAELVVKVHQLHRALVREGATFDGDLIDALDLATIQARAKTFGTGIPLMEKPDSVITRVSDPKYITDEGIEAIDVGIHYGNPEGGGKTKTHSVLRTPEKKQIAVIPFFPVDGGKYNTLIVRQWQPGCGSGDRLEAWCLGFPTGIYESDESIEKIIARIVRTHATHQYDEGAIRILSRTGAFDVNAGMTNAELEVIEVAFTRPLKQTATRIHGISSINVPTSPDFRSNIADMVKDGTRVDHVLSAFATKMYQLDNALKSTLDLEGGKHWSHALPTVMKDHGLEIGEEAQKIETSFTR